MESRENPLIPEYVRTAVAPLFDVDYYLAGNRDVRASGVDPLDHFCATGWREGRNPSPVFDVRYYLTANPDVSAADINPVLHYVSAGKKEGRQTLRRMNVQRRQIERALPPNRKAADWVGAANISKPISEETLHIRLSLRSTYPLILSISHDDYGTSIGGVQLLISDEQKAFARAGWQYLHVCPAAPLPLLAPTGKPEAFRFQLRLEGELLDGVATADMLARCLARLSEEGRRIEAVVHHLMGHSPEAIAMVLEAGRVLSPHLWIHDFFTLCPGYNLLRNDVKYCGAPPLNSQACGICCNGTDRRAHVSRVDAFFKATRPVVLSPSAVALEIWSHRSGAKVSETAIQPLARVVHGRAILQPSYNRPVRVAHLGGRHYHKGWHVFETLTWRLAGDKRYSFFQLGYHSADDPTSHGIQVRPAHTTEEDRDAMISAVAEAGIDVVLSWPVWPETFSYVTHEALAGGAFVITKLDAGNVTSVVGAHAPDQGLVARDEVELFALFETGQLLEILANAKRRRGALMRSSGTAAWMLPRDMVRRKAVYFPAAAMAR